MKSFCFWMKNSLCWWESHHTATPIEVIKRWSVLIEEGFYIYGVSHRMLPTWDLLIFYFWIKNTFLNVKLLLKPSVNIQTKYLSFFLSFILWGINFCTCQLKSLFTQFNFLIFFDRKCPTLTLQHNEVLRKWKHFPLSINSLTL